MEKESQKKQLGKGIRALLSSMDTEEDLDRRTLSKELSRQIADIPVEFIEANPNQPRQDFDEDAITELANSIRVHGIIQPLTLRRLSDEAYQIIAGERRFRAAIKAGLSTVPAYIRIADDQTLLEMALVENIQREDLNALEVAISMNRLIKECSLTHERLSERLGKNRSTVTNYLRLLKLPPQIQEAVRDKRLSMGHARALAGVEDFPQQLEIFKKVLSGDLSVRKLEEMIQKKEAGHSRRPVVAPTVTPEIKRLQDTLSDFFGTRIQIRRSAQGKGTIVIPFSDDDELNSILDLIDLED